MNSLKQPFDNCKLKPCLHIVPIATIVCMIGTMLFLTSLLVAAVLKPDVQAVPLLLFATVINVAAIIVIICLTKCCLLDNFEDSATSALYGITEGFIVRYAKDSCTVQLEKSAVHVGLGFYVNSSYHVIQPFIIRTNALNVEKRKINSFASPRHSSGEPVEYLWCGKITSYATGRLHRLSYFYPKQSKKPKPCLQFKKQ